MDDRVNVAALRDITDDSGGRTAIVHTGGDLQAATSGIAAELSQQYLLGYPGSDKKCVSMQMKGMDDREFKNVKFMADSRYAVGPLAWWFSMKVTFATS